MSKPPDFVISSDTPLTDPAYDAYGYAVFAQRIADAVCKTPSPQGLVMAIHGRWGVGKSSLLNFIKHDIGLRPKQEQPVIIDFNPWWFDSREHLASQFLVQFRVKLQHESEALRKIGDSMAEYSGSLGTLIATGFGVPLIDKPIAWILKQLGRKPKAVPTLKAEISIKLVKANQRFVFVIDDIDRLPPDEICELFKVIKALADFPNVVYLLSFDRNTVSEALRTALGVDGEAYLEKIIQASFTLPAVDRLRLRKKLFEDLDRVLESYPLRHFDQTYWGNIYWDGLDQYINKPRDVVRIINTLCVTYPAVVGEVNPTDFVALEFLRVFEPDVYAAIRDNAAMFTGYSDRGYGQDKEQAKIFHETWLSKVQATRQSAVKNLTSRLFPKLESVLGNMSYGTGWTTQWRKELRVCSPDIFDVYFQFGVSPDALRRTELDELIAIAADTERAIQILKNASAILRPDGTSKAREYLERLNDLVDEITPATASGLLTALFHVGDVLLSPGDATGGFTSVPNRWRLLWTVNHLLKRITEVERKVLLSQLIRTGGALCLVVEVVARIESYLSKSETDGDAPLAQISSQTFDEFKALVIDRLGRLDEQQLLKMPGLDFAIYSWLRWTSPEAVALRVNSLFVSDNYLPLILEKYLRFATTQTMGDRVSRQVPRLNPKQIEQLTDIAALEPRVSQMLLRADLTENQRIAGEQFIKGMALIREGKDPDGWHRDDD